MKNKKPEVELEGFVGAQFVFWDDGAATNFQKVSGVSPKGEFKVVSAVYLPEIKTNVGGIGAREEGWQMEIENSEGKKVTVTDFSGGPVCPYFSDNSPKL